MAWVNNKWVDYEGREEKIKLLKERIAKLKQLYDDGKANDFHIKTMIEDAEELKRLNRIHEAETDISKFAMHYLSDKYNPDNQDNAIRNSATKPHDDLNNLAPIHREFFSLCDYVDHTSAARVAVCSARGHSKSTIFSGVLPLHALVYRRDHAKYIMLLSETDVLAKQLLGWIKNQLKHNELLRKDFGELLSPTNTKNERDNEDSLITFSKQMVQASSTGKQLRGAKYGSYRPTLVICDDMSSLTGNEGTPEAREKLIHWWNSVLMPMPAADGRIIIVGTLTSKDGLLNHVLNRKDFRSSYHGAILKGPDNPSLWDEYMSIYSRSKDTAEADVFYNQHQYEMEAGIVLSWPWRWTYRALQHEKHAIGARAFSSEYLNKPYSEEDQVFKVDDFAFYTATNIGGRQALIYEGQTFYVDDLYKVGAWDPSMGANARACLNSFVTVGKDRKSGLIFVLDDFSKLEQVHIYIQGVVNKISEWKHDLVLVEGINAYSEFERQLRDLLRQHRIYQTKVNLIKMHKSSKQQRIDSLEPLAHNKTIIFSRTQQSLLDQFSEYPDGAVDTLDALEMAIANAARPPKRVIQKPAWL